MRSMVKLHDLVDLVKPPWQNIVEASTLGWSRDKPMGLDTEMADWDEDMVDLSNSPGEANLGLGCLVLCLFLFFVYAVWVL